METGWRCPSSTSSTLLFFPSSSSTSLWLSSSSLSRNRGIKWWRNAAWKRMRWKKRKNVGGNWFLIPFSCGWLWPDDTSFHRLTETLFKNWCWGWVEYLSVLAADITFLCLWLCISEGLHRFCHQCEASDPLHAPESPHVPVPSVALCGVTVFWIHRPGHDRSQHHCADDEGEENAKKNTSGTFGILLWVYRLLRETGRQMQGDSAFIKYWLIISRSCYLAWPH